VLDLIIRGGLVVDGSGAPGYAADVVVDGDRIAEVTPPGHLPAGAAAREIDANGKIVCPGFVDAHSHSDWSIHTNPTAESTVRQGVTTEIVGNCGLTNAPIGDASREQVERRLRGFGYDGPASWSTFDEYLDNVAAMGTSINLGWFVGHSTIRAAAGVVGSRVSAAQGEAMRGLVHEAMTAGAIGLSTGLEFEPGRTATRDELVDLATVVGTHGGLYTSHIRNRDAALQPAVDEFLDVAQQAGTPGQLSHLNVRHNTGAADGAWQTAVASMERRRREGLDVLADMTPLRDGIGLLAGILPPWLRAAGEAGATAMLRDPAVRQRLRGECDRYWRFIHRGEWQRVRLQASAQHPELNGMTFPEIADHWHKDEWECLFDILAAAGPSLDDVTGVAMLFSDEHLDQMAAHPLFCFAVDGYTSRVDGPLSERTRHPLSYSGMVHYLTTHVRERHTVSLEEAVRKMTSLPATRFGLDDRGAIRQGARADLVVLDFDRLEDGSTAEQPLAYCRGSNTSWSTAWPWSPTVSTPAPGPDASCVAPSGDGATRPAPASPDRQAIAAGSAGRDRPGESTPRPGALDRVIERPSRRTSSERVIEHDVRKAGVAR
jgi:N-acyl-D-amino-acid deacylase